MGQPTSQAAWYVPDSVKTGYEISFTRYFYKPQPMRMLEEIRADILALEKETEGMLGVVTIARGVLRQNNFRIARPPVDGPELVDAAEPATDTEGIETDATGEVPEEAAA